MKRHEWRASPAISVVLARFTELYARALRVDAARRVQRSKRLVMLIEKRDQR